MSKQAHRYRATKPRARRDQISASEFAAELSQYRRNGKAVR
jgi:hypothetical protein